MDDLHRPQEEEDWVLDQLLEEDYQAQIQGLLHTLLLPSLHAPPRRRSKNIDRGRLGGHERIWNDYFSDQPVYNDNHFRGRFRMRRQLFLKIMEKVVAHDVTFQQRADATGLVGLSSIQKVTAALRMLAYGSVADQLDEYVRIGESTAQQCLLKFCKAIHELFSAEYIRNPTMADTERILAFNQARGFPRMMGSIDCMHWQWRNCPRGWSGVFQGSKGHPTVVLEAIVSYDLWIWHAFFGMPGSLNDLNILDRSHVFQAQVEGVAPKCSFRVNGNEYTQTYLLADGIYPQWAVFGKSIKEPQGEKRVHFTKCQESARKDIERCFGVLQARWAIIREPARTWNQETLKLIMRSCIILHNMIVEDERGGALPNVLEADLAGIRVDRGEVARDTRLPSMHVARLHVTDREGSLALRNDLVDHLWASRGEA